MAELSILAREALKGENRHLTLLAAGGLLPLEPNELIPVQVRLARGEDSEVADRAAEALQSFDTRVLKEFLERDASKPVLAYFADNSGDPEVLEVILRRRDVDRSVLRELAVRLPPELQEVLLLRQDAIVEDPEILESLEKNARLSNFSRRRIREYRIHLLGEVIEEPAPASPETVSSEGGAKAAEAVQDIDSILGQVNSSDALADSLSADELSEGQIRLLPLADRMALTRGASKALRTLLIKDANPRVACAVLDGNAVSDQEIETIAKSRSVCDEVLEMISRKREWMRRYPVAAALASNPRTPLSVSTKLLSRLSIRDLRNLARDRGIPDALRRQARRMYDIKLQ